MFNFLIITIALILNVTKFSTSCTCLAVSFRNAVCDSHYVIRVKIYDSREIGYNMETDYVALSRLRSTNHVCYEFNIVEAYRYKNDTIKKTIEESKLFTTYHDTGLCGTAFQINKDYLVIGSVSDNKMLFVDSCSFIRNWNRLKSHEIENLKTFRDLNCDCDTEYCDFDGEECKKSKSEMCNSLTETNKNCDTNGVCIRDKKTRQCQWSISSDKHRCYDAFENFENQIKSS